MMSSYITIAILLANLIAIFIVYNIIKKLETKEKVIFISASVAIIYIFLTIVYWISGFGIDQRIHESSKNFVTYMFVPVNTILFIPYIASGYMKSKNNIIKNEEFVKRIFRVAIFALIVFVVEFLYFRNIQLSVKDIMKDVQNSKTVNQTIENNVTNNGVISNEIVNNENNNAIINNQIVNKESANTINSTNTVNTKSTTNTLSNNTIVNSTTNTTR